MPTLLKLRSILKLGKQPKPVRSAEEFQERLELYRSWTRGAFNQVVGWIIQVFFIALPFFIWARLFNRTKVINMSGIKRTPMPYMFVVNHLTMFDDLFLGGLLFMPYGILNPKYLPWHAPEEKNFFLGPIITFMMTRSRCIPLTRGHGVFQPGMTRLKELLQSEDAIVQIYPEGTRSRTGDIGRGKVGLGRLAYQAKANILPAYHEGTQDILPIGSHRLRIGKKMRVIIGEPLDMSDLYALPEGRESYQKIADRMIDSIKALRAQLHEMGEGVRPIPEDKKTVESEENSSDDN